MDLSRDSASEENLGSKLKGVSARVVKGGPCTRTANRYVDTVRKQI